MKTAYLLLGSNIGDPRNNLKRALELIEEKIGRIVKRSSIYKTAPWGPKDQPDFLNMVVEIKTGLKPEALMQVILSIEQELGRERKPEKRWGERIIDIDILFYNQEIINKENLKIPHPFLHKRRFTLIPLAEITGEDLVHPVLKKTVPELLETCGDDARVEKIT